MKNPLKKLRNYASFLLFRVRIFTRKKAKEIAQMVKEGDKILEIGSGPPDKKGNYYFSASRYFKGKKVEFFL